MPRDSIVVAIIEDGEAGFSRSAAGDLGQIVGLREVESAEARPTGWRHAISRRGPLPEIGDARSRADAAARGTR